MTKTLLGTAAEVSKRIAVNAGYGILDAITLGIGGSAVREAMRPPIDERLAKIEEAKKNLAEALTAIEDLQEEAQSNSRALDQLTAKLDKAEVRKTVIQKDIDTLRELAKLDADGVRKGLGIPTELQAWGERLLSFISGVAASLVATWFWLTFFS